MHKASFVKRSLALLMAAAMTTGLAGCGGGGGSAANNTIRVMVWDRGNAAPNTTTENNALTKWIQEQVKSQFGITVEYVSVPRSGSDEKLNTMMAGGEAPDIVFTYDQSLYYNYASNGGLTDLSDAYAKYGADIEKYCGEAQPISMLDGKKFAIMKLRGTPEARHTAYIRSDWLKELNMEIPKTKAELGEYLYAVKEKGLGTPWGMSGREDTEKMYLNFVGSYVPLPDEKTAYIYNEAYIVAAPEAKEGLKQLNQWYNDGLITQEFTSDGDESALAADLSSGKIGFTLVDSYQTWGPTEVLNNAVGHETMVALNCFELPDGSYRIPYEPRHAMFVMVPKKSSAKAEACVKYLNWMANPEVAENIYYTPDHQRDANGVALWLSEEDRNAKGYPGTCADLSIMTENFAWASDFDLLAKVSYENRASDWATLEWYQNYYKVCNSAKYIYPTFGYISDDEKNYGANVKTEMIKFVYRCIVAKDFEAEYTKGYSELVNKGLQKILDSRAAYYDTLGK